MTRKTPLKRSRLQPSRKPLKRGGRLRTRKVSKVETADGASEREIRDECDELVRRIIKLRDSRCVSQPCFFGGEIHVGHYIRRGVLALRWDLENCNGQCDHHNDAHEFNSDAYRIALANRYGGNTVRRLERIGRENPRLEYVDLLTIRDGLRRELKEREA